MSAIKDRELNNLHKFVSWASRPPFLDGRDAHPTRTIKILSYLILIPNNVLTVLAVAIKCTIVLWRGQLDGIVCWRDKGLVQAARDGNSI
ncbi:hypothetical protein QT973_02210 [Microcoleus sp. Z1_A1]|uniref:hypothetical protein n=1 Tax=unclassified Microcoleus TaxID=2642155 RepID=UPI002FD4EFDF